MRTALAGLVAGIGIVACSDSSTPPTAPTARRFTSDAAARATVVFTTQRGAWSDAFVNSIGTNVHLSYWYTAYGNLSGIVKPRLQALGIRHVRDKGGVVASDSWMHTTYGSMNWLHSQTGVTFLLVTEPATYDLNYAHVPLTRLLNFIAPGTVDGLEGLNEMDDRNIANWAWDDRTWQQALYRAAKTDPRSRTFTVLGPSVTHGTWAATQLGDLSAYMDMGNIHSYAGGRTPEPWAQYQMGMLGAMNGTHRYHSTESGYHTGASNGNQPYISNLAMAKYIPRMFMEYFANGVLRTYSFELADMTSNPSAPEWFGLVTANGTPKPCYNALKNLIGLLADPGSSISPGTLTYSLNGAPSSIHHTLLQKRNGRFYLALWQTAPTFNLSTEHDVSNPNIAVHVSLASAHQVNLYTPLNSASAQSLGSTSSLTVQVPDHVVILEIIP
jgi:hypothetical protein